MGYPVGRIVIENMRTDSANLILGQRVNTWVSILVFLLGVVLWRRFGRMEQPVAPMAPEGTDAADGTDGTDATDGMQGTDVAEDARTAEPEDSSVQGPADGSNDTSPGVAKVDRSTQS